MRIPSLEDIAKSTKFRVGAAVLAGVAAYNIANDYTPTLTKKTEAADAATQPQRGTKEFYDSLAKQAEMVQNADQCVSLLAVYTNDEGNNSSSFFNNLGWAQYKKGLRQDAEANLSKAIKLNPQNPAPYVNLGALYKDTGRNKEAIACFEQYLKLKPEYSNAPQMRKWIDSNKQ